MKLQSSFLVLAIAALIAPAAVAGQQGMEMEWGQKVRPAPVGDSLLADGVVVADAGSAVVPSLTSQQKYDAAFSVCGAAVPTTHTDYPIANYLEPTGLAWSYFKKHGVTITEGATNVSIIEAPAHGVLNTEGLAPWVYKYVPNADYLGPDQITFEVEWMGKRFKVIETVWVANVAPEYGGCPADYKLPPATTGNDKRGALRK